MSYNLHRLVALTLQDTDNCSLFKINPRIVFACQGGYEKPDCCDTQP